jgi:hypothetical protein
MKQHALIAIKEILLPLDHPRLIDYTLNRRRINLNAKLSMESNCRSHFKLFELNQLKIWANFKHINFLLGKRHMIRHFQKNLSKIPVDNGSSLNKLITLKIIALTNITLIIETSVLVV